MMGEVANEYQRLLDSYRGIERAAVITAIPLNDQDKLRLGEHLGTIISKEVVIKSEADSSLIGGVVARVGGKLLDGSTRSRLEALQKEMSGLER